jgi:hypothetical protein
MSLRKTAFALVATLLAFAWSGWEQFTYAMTPAQKRGWFIAISLVVSLALAWGLKPFVVKLLMFIN